jgi:hypothetical protein
MARRRVSGKILGVKMGHRSYAMAGFGIRDTSTNWVGYTMVERLTFVQPRVIRVVHTCTTSLQSLSSRINDTDDRATINLESL